MKNIKWVIVFAVLCAVCAAVWVLRGAKTNGTKALINQGGDVVREIDLGSVEEPYEFDMTDGRGGYNRIRVERGRIAVIDADCPDRICVAQGYISDDTVPIVCLPHKLSIVVEGADAPADAIAGAR